MGTEDEKKSVTENNFITETFPLESIVDNF